MKSLRKCALFSLALSAGMFLGGVKAQAALFDAGRDLLANEKPDNAGETNSVNQTVPQWSYGYRSTTTGTTFTPFTVADHTNGVGGTFDGFADAAGSPCCGALPHVQVNTGAATGRPEGSVATGEITMHPDGDAGGNFGLEQKPLVRFTASVAGTYSVNALWEDLDSCCGTNNNSSPGVDVHVVTNIGGVSTSVFDDAISRETNEPVQLPTSTIFSSAGLLLGVGDSIDFVVGTNGQLFGDETRFNATLDIVPEPATLSLMGVVGAGLLARRRR